MQKRAKIGISSLAGLVVILITFLLINHFVISNAGFEKELIQMAKDINQNCPFVLDEDTRLDNVTGGPGHVMTYNYTILNYSKSEINTDDLESYLKPQLVQTIESDEDMKVFRDHEVTLIYQYMDKNGAFVLSVKVTPDDYNQKESVTF